jgi:hypothetical protein
VNRINLPILLRIQEYRSDPAFRHPLGSDNKDLGLECSAASINPTTPAAPSPNPDSKLLFPDCLNELACHDLDSLLMLLTTNPILD